MRRFFHACLIAASSLLSLLAAARAADPLELEWAKLADGVWAGVRPVSLSAPPTSSTLIVIGDTGVFVFDPAGTPLAGERVLAKIRSLTERPVTHIAISNWRGAHSRGADKIVEAFPDAQIIAHEFTARAIENAENTFAQRGDKPKTASNNRFEKALAGGEAAATTRAYFEEELAHRDLVEREIGASRPVEPTRIFSDALSIDVGGRKIELRHMGPGKSHGDIIAYLPKERILATGDIVVSPTPFGANCHPKGWVRVLEQLKTLPADKIVPGHGAIMTDTDYFDLLIGAINFASDEVARAVRKGMSLEETKEAMDWSEMEPRFTGGDPLLAIAFNDRFKTPIVEAAYKIANGEDSEPLELAGR
ncbi:MAG: MBL fold metallo-hydrolase [Parvularculaceae bacterium]|nr:MBL fold metallo-hydrolase [Parvularculaceae bacterium]